VGAKSSARASKKGHEVNVRRGINRSFIVVWPVYAIWALWYPVHVDLEWWAINATGRYSGCMDRATTHDMAHDAPAFQECADEHTKEYFRIYDSNRIWRTYFSNQSGWIFFRIVLVPAAAYGIVRILARILGWILQGFKGTPTQPA
jgi:hypothetical protein